MSNTPDTERGNDPRRAAEFAESQGVSALMIDTSSFFESPTHVEIYAALIGAFGELSNVTANKTADVRSDRGNYSYKYMDLGAILASIRGPLANHGLAVIQAPAIMADGRGRSVEISTRLIHTSGEWLENRIAITIGGNGDAQATGSAMTYARRYGVTALLGIASGDDDDGRAASAPSTSTPGDYEQAETPTVTKAEARRRVLTAVGGEPGVAPPDDIRALYEGAWADFFGDRPGPYTESGMAAIMNLIPQWLEGRTSQDPTQPVSNGASSGEPGPGGESEPNGESGPETASQGVDRAARAAEEVAAQAAAVRARDEEALGVVDQPELPDERVEAIIAEVQAMSQAAVRKRLGDEMLDTRGNADAIRLRLAQHIRAEETTAYRIELAKLAAPVDDLPDDPEFDVDGDGSGPSDNDDLGRE